MLSSFFLNELCTRDAIRDFSNLCGIEVYSVEKSFVCTDVAVRTPNWSSDDNRHVEFLFTPLRLVVVAQYLISPSLMMDSNFNLKELWRHKMQKT